MRPRSRRALRWTGVPRAGCREAGRKGSFLPAEPGPLPGEAWCLRAAVRSLPRGRGSRCRLAARPGQESASAASLGQAAGRCVPPGWPGGAARRGPCRGQCPASLPALGDRSGNLGRLRFFPPPGPFLARRGAVAPGAKGGLGGAGPCGRRRKGLRGTCLWTPLSALLRS